MNENQKKRLALSISGYFKKAIKLTAITVTLSVPVALFAQDSGCDSDHDCIIVIGNPPPDPPDPGYDGPTPGCDYLGDSDCNDSGGESSGGGGGSGPNPHTAVCRALLQNKPNNCFNEPLPPNQHPWGQFHYWDFITKISLEQGAILDYNRTQYENLLNRVALRYYQTESVNEVITTFWSVVLPYCDNNFPEVGSGFDIWPFDNEADCVNAAYRASSVFTVTFNTPYVQTILSTFGLDSLANRPTQGIFGARFYNNIRDVQLCKAYYVERREENCIE